MISAVVPRPIAFVSSLSADGVGNLSPFSYATVISHDPPCVMFSACRKPGGAKKGHVGEHRTRRRSSSCA